MTPPEFRELVGAFSNLGEDNDFVRAAVEREAEERRELDQKRIQAVAEDARRRAAGWVRAPAKEGGETLLDRTMVLYGSNLGDANAHSTTNLPTLFAGGGFKHGRHLAFDRTRNYPLPNLFVSVLQRLGIEAASFGPSTGTMRGLEVA